MANRYIRPARGCLPYKGMAIQPIITPAAIGQMVSLLDWCYKMGVNDARGCADEGLVREFCDKVSQPGVFGFITDDYTINWQEWSLRLLSRARMKSWNGAMRRYFNLAGKFGQNWLSCFFNFAEVWYCKGLKDYTEAPDGCDMAVFNGQNRVYWTAKGIKKVNNRHYVDELQLESFSLERRDTSIWEGNAEYDARKQGALKPRHYQFWRAAVGLAAQKKC